MMIKSKEKNILPGLHLPDKPGKNFLLENIKRLRDIQKETQKKLAARCPPPHQQFQAKKAPDLRFRGGQKRNKSESQLGMNSERLSMKSRQSTPVTVMASPKPMKNQKVQTSPRDLTKSQVSISKPSICSISPTIEKPLKKPFRHKMARSASVPSISIESSESVGDVLIGPSVEVAANLKKLDALHNLIGEKKNFVAYNTFRSYEEKPKPKAVLNEPTKLPPNYKIGVVPRYILESKKGIARPDEKGDSLPDENVPPGYILLSDRERKDQLVRYKKAYSELLVKLRNIPLSSDSYSNRQRKTHLERELDKLEKQMNLFSRNRVCLKVDGC